MYNFYSKIVGSTFIEGGQEKLSLLKENDILILKREPDNQYDKNAIAIYHSENKIGHVPADTAKSLAPQMDVGIEVDCHVSSITGGGENNTGCNISITVND